jgi:hypothetical protein
MYTICLQLPDLSPVCEPILKRIIRDLPLDDKDSECSLDFSNSSQIESALSIFKYFRGYSNLYQADIFSQCFNSPLVSMEKRSFYLNSIMFEIKIFFLDVLLKENPRPFNLFDVAGFPIYYIGNNDPITLTIFFELFTLRDPIVLLLLMSRIDLLASYEQYIVDKFDLNNTYFFARGIHFHVYTFSRFVGKTLHFKQLIKEMNDPELFRVFSSNPHEFDGEFLPSEPIIEINRNMSGFYFKSE